VRRLAAAIVAVLLLTASSPPPKIGLTILVSTAGDHLRAHFHATQAVAEITLDDHQPGESEVSLRLMRKRQWRPVGPGWLPCANGLAKRDGTPFEDADLDIYPDDVPLTYIDPMVFSAGGGFVLSSRYLLADQQHFDTVLVFVPRDGEFFDTGAPGLASLAQRDFTRAMYLGPAASLTGEDGARIVASPDFPAAARNRILAGVKRSLAFYRERVGLSLPWQPTLILAQLPPALDPSHTNIIGKPAPGGVVTFRFFGPDALSGADAANAALDHVAAHEAFHFWDAFLARLRDGNAAPWLYEGGADYAALLARRAAGQLDDAALYQALDLNLRSCRRQLGTQGLDQLPGPDRYRLAYPCGLVIQWICDMAIQHATHQQSGVLDLWHDLLVKGKAEGGRYRMDDFRAGLAARDASALAAVDLLLAPNNGDRWTRLRRQMEAYGVRTAPALQSETEASVALFSHLIELDCAKGGSWQLTEGLSGFQLYLGSRACRHFGPTLVIRAVEGFSLTSNPYSAHSAVLQKCAFGKTVDLTLGNGQSIGVVCSRPMAPLAYSPPDFVVTGLP
jgi:hypothetical protein